MSNHLPPRSTSILMPSSTSFGLSISNVGMYGKGASSTMNPAPLSLSSSMMNDRVSDADNRANIANNPLSISHNGASSHLLSFYAGSKSLSSSTSSISSVNDKVFVYQDPTTIDGDIERIRLVRPSAPRLSMSSSTSSLSNPSSLSSSCSASMLLSSSTIAGGSIGLGLASRSKIPLPTASSIPSIASLSQAALAASRSRTIGGGAGAAGSTSLYTHTSTLPPPSSSLSLSSSTSSLLSSNPFAHSSALNASLSLPRPGVIGSSSSAFPRAAPIGATTLLAHSTLGESYFPFKSGNAASIATTLIASSAAAQPFGPSTSFGPTTSFAPTSSFAPSSLHSYIPSHSSSTFNPTSTLSSLLLPSTLPLSSSLVSSSFSSSLLSSSTSLSSLRVSSVSSREREHPPLLAPHELLELHEQRSSERERQRLALQQAQAQGGCTNFHATREQKTQSQTQSAIANMMMSSMAHTATSDLYKSQQHKHEDSAMGEQVHIDIADLPVVVVVDSEPCSALLEPACSIAMPIDDAEPESECAEPEPCESALVASRSERDEEGREQREIVDSSEDMDVCTDVCHSPFAEEWDMHPAALSSTSATAAKFTASPLSPCSISSGSGSGCGSATSSRILPAASHLWSVELTPSILRHWFDREVLQLAQAPVDYLLRQPDLNAKMREILVDWLHEVGARFHLQTETLFLAVNLLDRFLSARAVGRKQLQLVGCVALLLAAKYEEIYIPPIADFIVISDSAYGREQILAMESAILSALSFSLTHVSPLRFMQRFMHLPELNWMQTQTSAESRCANLCNFLLELSLQFVAFLAYKPSVLAAAVVYLVDCHEHHSAAPGVGAKLVRSSSFASSSALLSSSASSPYASSSPSLPYVWSASLQSETRCTESSLIPVLRELYAAWSSLSSSSSSTISASPSSNKCMAIHRKYGKERNGCVNAIQIFKPLCIA